MIANSTTTPPKRW